jgi:UDPglucose 6-dehydrogenase
MKIAVCGLWHLGTVTAACLAAAGHEVVAFDENVNDLALGKLPVSEPGLEKLVQSGIAEGKLCFLSTDQYAYIFGRATPELVWICWDTPVDDNDVADAESVREKIRQLFPYLMNGQTVAISSQLPVGSTTAIEKEFYEIDENSRATDVGFAYVPENLRLGNAIECFQKPGWRTPIGARNEQTGILISAILNIPTRLMSPESAEMCKHAINAFLATQIALTNEIAVICEKVGADARDVEAALRSEPRIGPKAYVKAGAAFAGGTLARDLNYLSEHGSELTESVLVTNKSHKFWGQRQLVDRLGPLKDKVIAVWGITYKAGTDTLRRSATVELIDWMFLCGATVNRSVPNENMRGCLRDADALIIGTEDPLYRIVEADDMVRLMRRPLVIDPSGWLNITDPRIEYVVVGRSTGHGKA